MFGLEEQGRIQGNLLNLAHDTEQKPTKVLTAALDRINQRYGKRALYYGAEG